MTKKEKDAISKSLKKLDIAPIHKNLKDAGLENLSVNEISFSLGGRDFDEHDGQVCVKWDNQIVHVKGPNGEDIVKMQPVCVEWA
ncbi:MAG TPA: hypothetical protein VK588_13815 [Chitinophagaceae bacterium]|nr:hypothetical protein [Chitinophagaceae bacterium]